LSRGTPHKTNRVADRIGSMSLGVFSAPVYGLRTPKRVISPLSQQSSPLMVTTINPRGIQAYPEPRPRCFGFFIVETAEAVLST
jgi:hypothetical protein